MKITGVLSLEKNATQLWVGIFFVYKTRAAMKKESLNPPILFDLILSLLYNKGPGVRARPLAITSANEEWR
jgi:hypothetical protein